MESLPQLPIMPCVDMFIPKSANKRERTQEPEGEPNQTFWHKLYKLFQEIRDVQKETRAASPRSTVIFWIDFFTSERTSSHPPGKACMEPLWSTSTMTKSGSAGSAGSVLVFLD